MQGTAITTAIDLVREIGVADVWATIVREGGHCEMLVEVDRWRQWVRRREKRGARDSWSSRRSGI